MLIRTHVLGWNLSPIIRKLLPYLGVAPGQLMPNGWQYFLATFLQWPTVFPRQVMSIPKFLNIFGPHFCQANETVTFIVRWKNQFIKLGSTYSNNKHWSEQFFYISGNWEASPFKTLLLKHIIPREWGTSQEDCKCSCFSLSSIWVFLFLMSGFISSDRGGVSQAKPKAVVSG